MMVEEVIILSLNVVVDFFVVELIDYCICCWLKNSLDVKVGARVKE